MSMQQEKTGTMFEETVRTTNDNRIKLIENSIKFLNDNKIDVNVDHYELYLILDEAISNAMEHGNTWNADKHVIVKILNSDEEKVEIRIKDEGNGFNPQMIPEQPREIHNLSSRGRGIIIIKKFCKVLWNEVGNEIQLLLSKHK